MAWLEPHHGRVLTSQLELQQDQAYTDFTLKLQDGEVRTCRFLLASLSPFFSRMLATDMRERREGVLTLENVRMEDWNCLLNFYLSGNKLVTADNVEDILAIAHMYELEALEKHCGQVLVDTLTPENCCDRLALSKKHQLSAAQEILDFIKKNFVTVGESQQFSSLSKEDLMQLLNSGGIVTSEKILCESVLKWLSSNEVDEESSIEILSQLKLEHLSWEFLCDEFLYHDQVVRNTRVRQIVTEEMKKRGGPHSLSNHDVIRTRLPKGKVENIVILGHDARNFHAFHIHQEGNGWMELPTVHVKDYFAAHMVADTIFITGGDSNERSTYQFHTRTKTWEKGPDLLQGRAVHGMTSVGSSLFVLGGIGSGRVLTSIEKHDIGSNHWGKVGDLQRATRMSGVAAVGDVIIVAGGYETPDFIQTFDVSTQITALLETRLPCPMRKVRGAGLAGGAVFLGEDGDLIHVSLSDSKVTVISHVRLSGFGSLGFFGLAVADGHLLCFGGGRECENGTKVDRYSLQGAREDRNNLPELPVALKVHGAFMTLF